MIAAIHRWPSGATTWAGIVCVLLAPPCTGSARAQGVPAVTPPVAVSASDVPSAEPAFKALVERYYDGVARKDIAAVEQVWHTGGPARSQRNIVAMDFELRDVSLVSLNLSGVAADAGGGKARVVADLAVTVIKTRHKRHERRVRDLTFLPEGGAWKVWNEASAGPQLAQRLLSVSGAERDRLIAAEPELLSEDALAGLTREVERLRGEGISPRILDVLSLQGRLARAVGNSAVLARSYLDTGLIHQIAGNPEPAIAAFSEARDAFIEAGDAAQVAACDTNLGNVAYLLRNYATALGYYQQALDEYEALKDEPRAASLRHSIGNVYFVQGEFERAIESYQQGLSVFERTGDTFAAARVLQALGQVHKELGSYGAAAEAWRRCIDLSLTASDTIGAATAHRMLGEIHRLQGDFARALESHTKSLALWDKTADVANRAATIFAIGQISAAQRVFGRAIEWYQRALDIDRKEGLDAGVARDLGGLAGAHVATGQPGTALAEYQESLALREKTRDTTGAMWTLVHMGVLHALEGRHPEALAVLQRALDLAPSAQAPDGVAIATALRARSLLASGDVDGSLAVAAQAAELAVAIGHFDVVAHARVTTGRAQRQAGRSDQARASFEEALAALTRTSADPAAETFFSDRRSPYLAMMDLLLSENKGAEAFAWSERLRQRALADMLGAGGLFVTKGVSPAERDDERRMAKESRTLAVRLQRERTRAKPDPEQLAALQSELETHDAAREVARRALYDKYPHLRVLRGQSEPIGIDGVTGLLADDGTVVLSYVVSEARAWVFAVTRDTASGQAVLKQAASIEVPADDIAKRVDAFVRAVSAKDGAAAEASRALHILLLEPVRASLAGASRLVVVPDAFLWVVPFEALQDASGRYLIEDASVTYAPSLTALAAVDAWTRPRPDPPTLVAVANPVPGKTAEERIALLRTAPASRPAEAELEVKAVSAFVGPASRRVLTGDRARVTNIVEGASDGATLHVASSAFISHASPLFSTVLLTPADPADPEGGLVDVADIMTWELPAEAAVFTRIEPGGASSSGEGLIGLAWGLFVAGTPTLVANRWPLHEPAAAAFVPDVYRSRLARLEGRPEGRSWAESIQRAAKRQLAKPSTRHPYYWAGLLVIGP